MEKEIQFDLFEQINQRVRKRIYYPSLRKFFPYGFLNIRLSYEGIIFSLIVFLLLCVVLFSLGMERGKNLMQDRQKNRTTLEQKSVPQTVKHKYTVQLFAYKDKTLAMKKIEQLTRDGYKPFIIYSGNLYQICIGKYLSKEDAKKNLALLSKKYGSGYIRNIPAQVEQ